LSTSFLVDANPPLVTNSDCDLEFSVPDDFQICEEGSVSICGVINSDYSDYVWYVDGWDTGKDLCDDFEITEETVLTLEVIYSNEDNLIENGDFEDGNSGFTTDYTVGPGNCFHVAGFLTCEGFYHVMDNPTDGLSAFDPCSDFIGGSEMMVVNGSGGIDNVWCQEVCIDPDASYAVSAWATSVHPDSPAELQFAIDGDFIGSDITLSSSTCDWEQFSANWSELGETSVEICILNLNTEPQGNDFAIDGIELYETCVKRKEFTVTVSDLEVATNDPDTINCINPISEIAIDVSNSNDFTINWETLDGTIEAELADGDSLIVSAAGTYTVTVTDSDYPDCEYIQSFVIAADTTSSAFFELELSNNLTCLANFAEISTDSVFTSVSWSSSLLTPILETNDTLVVTQAGSYYAEIINASGCIHRDTIVVEEVVPSFDYFLQGDNLITCSNPAANLIVDFDPAVYVFQWQGSAATFGNDPSIAVDESGTYTFMLTDSEGCTTTDEFIVDENITTPTISATATMISCSQTESTISITDQQNEYSVNWEHENGMTFIDQDQFVSTQPGTVYYTITDLNGCQKMDSIEIQSSTDFPELTLSGNDITCDTPITEITTETNDNIISYSWIDPVNATGTASGFIGNEAGTYNVTVTSDANCTSVYSITIGIDTVAPIVEPLDDLTLDCIQEEVDIEATINSSYLSLLWNGPNLESPQESIEISEQGSYSLTVLGENGCSSNQMFNVELDTMKLEIDISDPLQLDCDNSSFMSTATVNGNYNSATWTDPAGNAIAELNITIDQPGNYNLEVVGENGCVSTLDYLVTQDVNAVDFDVSSTPIDCLNPFSQINVTNTAPTAQIEFISNGDLIGTGTNIQVNDDTPITVIVTDVNGCSATRIVTANLDTVPPSVEPIADITLNCVDSEVTVQANINSNYSDLTWSGPQIESDEEEIVVSELGNYELVVYGENYCVTTQYFSVELDITPVEVNISDPILLDCDNTSFVPVVDILDNYTSVTWQLPSGGISTGMDISISEAGLYLLVVIGENGCETSQEYIVGQDIDAVSFDVAASPIDCLNPFSDISTTNAPSNADIEYFIDGTSVGTGSSIQVLDDSEIIVIVTDVNGCSATRMITPPIDTSSIDFTVSGGLLDCNNPSIAIELNTTDNFSSATLYDSSGDLIAELVSGAFENEVSSADLYTIQVVGENGCVSERQINIEENFDQIDFDLSTEAITCENPIISIELITTEIYTSGDVILAGTNDINDLSVLDNIDTPGIYEVTLIGENGCAFTKEIEVKADTDNPSMNPFSTEVVGCNESALLSNLVISGGMAPYSVFIDDELQAANSQSYDLQTNILYELLIEDANGCKHDTTFTIQEIEIISADLIPEVTIEEGEQIQLQLELNKPMSDILSITWLPAEGLSCYDCPDPIFSGTSNTEYQVLVTDLNGCETTVEMRINIIVRPEEQVGLYLPNIMYEGNNQGRFTLYTAEQSINQINSLQIYDRWGNMVFVNENFQPNEPSEGWNGRYNNQAVNPGVYTYLMEIEYLDGTLELIVDDITIIK